MLLLLIVRLLMLFSELSNRLWDLSSFASCMFFDSSSSSIKSLDMYRLSFLPRLFLMLLLMGLSLMLRAQTSPCASDGITFDITPTESFCQRDGTLTFTPRGANAENFANYMYEIRSMVAGGANIPATMGPTVRDLPAGAYRVIVTATCKTDASVKFQTTLTNVVVPGTYVVPNLYFDALASRGSYAGSCHTGKIVMDLTGGRGNYTFNVVASPGDAYNGPIELIKSGTSYAFPGENYPAGSYRLEATDECGYTAVSNFELSTMTELPTFQYENLFDQGLYPVLSPAPSCNSVRINRSIDPAFYQNRPALSQAILDGMYEVGLSKKGEEPQVWHTISALSVNMELSLGTHKVNEFQAANSLQVNIRLKACPEIKRTFTTYLRRKFTSSTSFGCGVATITVRPWTDYDGHYCFPLTISAYESLAAFNGGNSPLSTKILYKHADTQSFTLNTGESRYFRVTDADGQFFYEQTLSGPVIAFYRSTNAELLDCEGFYSYFYYQGATCSGVTYDIYNISDPNNHVFLCSGIPGQRSCRLPYNTNLRAYLRVPDQPTLNLTWDFREDRPNVDFTPAYENINYCLTNVARFRIQLARLVPIGTQLIVTGPNGFRQELVTTSYNQYWTFPETRIEPGEYTFTRQDGCTTDTKKLTIPVILQVKDFSVRTEKDCSQLKVFPTGLITYQGSDNKGATYFRVSSGPAGGFDPSQRITATQAEAGAFFSLSKPGTYMIGISYQNNCVFQEIPVEFERTNLRLDNNRTIAFSCMDGTKQGHLYVKSIGGTDPYIYELYDEANQVPTNEQGVEDGDRWHFTYGTVNDIYTLRIEDGCGNRFSQQLKILDLSQLTLAGAISNIVCVGDPIELTSLPLGGYKWYKPDGTLFSTEQNPVIQNPTQADSGLYRVEVTSTGCGSTTTGHVRIDVVPCYAPVNPILMNKVVTY